MIGMKFSCDAYHEEMPIDFARVPPRRTVPDTSRLSRVTWTLLFVLIAGSGAAVSIYTWPRGEQISAWFWIRTVVLPVFGWTILLLIRAAWSGAERSMAIAMNAASDVALEACHLQASIPLQLLGYSWCWSGNANENTISRIFDRSFRLEPKKNGSWGNKSIAARWIDIPDNSFAPSNALGERARHKVLLEWMLSVLLKEMSDKLRTLPKLMPIKVTLSLDADVPKQDVTEYLIGALNALGVNNPFRPSVIDGSLSIFHIDRLLDEADTHTANLIISIQLRGVISDRLLPGEAEAGVALLLCANSAVTSNPASIQVHRPAQGSAGFPEAEIVNAARWGNVAPDQPVSFWTTSLLMPVLMRLDALKKVASSEKIFSVDTAVGDCGVANSWLALALAASQSHRIGEPQVVAIAEHDQFFALTCRTS